MKKQFNLNLLERDTKVKLLKALIEGKISKEELYKGNPEEIALLLSNQWALLHVSMGDEHTYTFSGKNIDKEEFERLSKLSKALGVKEIVVNVKEPKVPLANDEN